MGTTQVLNQVEQECIGLCVVIEAIDDFVNRALLGVTASVGSSSEASVWFPTMAHRDLFLIRMQDFVTERGDATIFGAKISCLEYLSRVADEPTLGKRVSMVRSAADQLTTWLDEKVHVELWLSTLNLNARISVPRRLLLQISGNQSKHNLSRLTKVCKQIADALSAHGHVIDQRAIPLALEDLHGHLSEDFFIYYVTQAAELMNNARWALQNYLTPEFDRAFYVVPGNEEGRYAYHVPAEIKDEIAIDWYWKLMNHVRSGPIMRRFMASKYLRGPSLLICAFD